MDQFLKSLTTRSKMLDAEMDAERRRLDPDGERLVALKRIKRQLGAQIDYIRREGRQITEVMVVRKPRRFTDLRLKPIR
ncbi:hypothetical protein AncyloWKF20_14980 [Ancylobacter sp. WKF20]|uniref:hypothetical protein n=1 Tax=Ancylobacter sp. WKF20 TaxID=3039801 RepID=UPI0024342F3A|nr:hypothetical protein [Ancylobacter sp. WKF20]WGD29078.1 hypothetical protein AncyloWKF20_14980 [Ancylobacter sp. WKF20]